MKSTRLASALGVAGAMTLALQAFAGGEKIAFPEGFEKGVLYATVDRYDIKQYRELYSTKPAVDAIKAGKPIPSGTVLTLVQYKAKVDDKGVPVKDANGHFQKGDVAGIVVMEKRDGWGTEYPDDIRNGNWEYQAFTADKKVNDKANLKSCFQCHKPHAGQDFVMSLARLSGTGPGGKVMAQAGPTRVAIGEFTFGPETLQVANNAYVTWTNTDDSPHQVTIAGVGGTRTPILLKGQSQALKFTAPGTYEYICGLHPGMKGKIEVK